MNTRKSRIRIIEDDVQLRLLPSPILEDAGSIVRPAADAPAALEEMRAENPMRLSAMLFIQKAKDIVGLLRIMEAMTGLDGAWSALPN